MSEKQESKLSLRSIDWPDKDLMFELRNEYIVQTLDEHIKNVELDFPDCSEQTKENAAKIVARAWFVASYCADRVPVNLPFPISIVPFAAKNSNFPAAAAADVELNGEIMSLHKLSVNDIKRAKLSSAKIAVNLSYIISKIEYLEKNTDKYLELFMSDDKLSLEQASDAYEEMYNEEVEELAIVMEESLIHELSHGFYFFSLFNSTQKSDLKLGEYLVAHQNSKFDSNAVSALYFWFDNNAQDYYKQREEWSARLWESSFLKRYYPESDTARNFQNTLSASKRKKILTPYNVKKD